jgi:hypothetical protein
MPLLAGCVTFTSPATSAVEPPIERVDVTPALYFALAWPRADTVVTDVLTRDGPWVQDRLHAMQADGSDLTPIDVADAPRCRRVEFTSPARLPDGRLGFGLGCSKLDGPPDWSLWALDLSTGQTEALAAVPDQRQPDRFSWSRDMTTAWYAAGSGICEGIRATGPDGPEVLDLRVGTGDRSFTLEEAYQSSLGGDCVGVGWAESPAWSPTADVVAFFASTKTIGREGWGRLDAPGDLYLWDPATQELMTLLEGFVEPRGLRWSPDGHWLAFTGKRTRSPARTWLFRPADGTLVPLTTTFLDFFDWSPDGRELMGVVRDPERLLATDPESFWDPDLIEVVRIPLPTGVGPDQSPKDSPATSSTTGEP